MPQRLRRESATCSPAHYQKHRINGCSHCCIRLEHHPTETGPVSHSRPPYLRIAAATKTHPCAPSQPTLATKTSAATLHAKKRQPGLKPPLRKNSQALPRLRACATLHAAHAIFEFMYSSRLKPPRVWRKTADDFDAASKSFTYCWMRADGLYGVFFPTAAWHATK